MKRHLLCAVAVATAVFGLSGVSAHAQDVADTTNAQTVFVAPSAPAAAPAPRPRPSFLSDGGVSVYVGYAYLDNALTQGSQGSGTGCGLCEGRSGTSGFALSATAWINPNFGLTADISGHAGSPVEADPDGDGGAVRLPQSSFYFLFGPSVQKSVGKVNLFAHALVGVNRMWAGEDFKDCSSCTFVRDFQLPIGTGFAVGVGGGADWMFTHKIGWRVAQVDYLWSNNLVDFCEGCRSSVNNVRISTGLVFNFGGMR